MEEYQERVIAEKAELSQKLSKLTLFFGTIQFQRLPALQRSQLLNQSRFMEGYLAVLEERIAGF